VSESVKLIVDGYVSLKDRMALEEMRQHRHRLKGDLQQNVGGCFDVSGSLRLFDEDLRVIEEGFARLQA
jgi:hypothetical protein